MNKRIISILSIILLVSLILHFSYVLVHINHECSHDDKCPICRQKITDSVILANANADADADPNAESNPNP